MVKNVDNMNIVIVGHVDHGKSTIIGRLLADTNSLPEGKLAQVKETCRRNSKPFEFAFLLDALKEEQAQGITIDAARVFFKTPKRKYIIIDAPGHIEFLKNMVTGAARAEAALLVIDANEGVMENSKRHGYLLSMLGIKQVVVLVNKMDLIDYDQSKYEQIVEEYSAFLSEIGVEADSFVPVSGFRGDNIAAASSEMSWYTGRTVLEKLDLLDNKKGSENQAFRMPVQGIYKFTAGGDYRRIVAGTIDSGKIKVGDEVVFYPSKKKSTVKSIERFSAPEMAEDCAGSATGFTLEQQIYITRGELACIVGEAQPEVSRRIKTKLFWLGAADLDKSRKYHIKIGTQKVTAELERVITVFDASTLSTTSRPNVHRHEVAEVIFNLEKEMAMDKTDFLTENSRFVLIDNFEISGGGIVVDTLNSGQTQPGETRVPRAEGSISAFDYNELKKDGFLRQRQRDMYIARFRSVAGNLTSQQLRELADLADKYGKGYIHVTTRQGVEIPWVKSDDCLSLNNEIKALGLMTGASGPRIRTIVSCPGCEVCAQGIMNSRQSAVTLDQDFFGRSVPMKTKIAVSGCPNSCAKPQENDIGFVGAIEPVLEAEKCISCGLCEKVCPNKAIKMVEGKPVIDSSRCLFDGKCISSCPVDAWQEKRRGYLLYAGGKIGRNPRLGVVLEEFISQEGVSEAAEKVLAAFERLNQKSERISDTIARVGVDAFREEMNCG